MKKKMLFHSPTGDVEAEMEIDPRTGMILAVGNITKKTLPPGIKIEKDREYIRDESKD